MLMIEEARLKTKGTLRGVVDMDGLMVEITIKAARRMFDRVDVLVTPVSGYGRKWIDLSRVNEVRQ